MTGSYSSFFFRAFLSVEGFEAGVRELGEGKSVATSLGLFSGKKTYLAAIGMAILGVVELCLGDVPQGLQALLAAATAAGLRGAITQSQP